MARYIDADKLIAEYDRVHIGPAGGARKLIVEAPTADVVPKSEADEIAEELSDTIVMKDELFDEVIKLRGELANAKTEVAREIFEEIERLLAVYSYTDEYGKEVIGVDVEELIAELKKKYTEEKK